MNTKQQCNLDLKKKIQCLLSEGKLFGLLVAFSVLSSDWLFVFIATNSEGSNGSRFTLHLTKLKTHQSPVTFDLFSRKTRSRNSRDCREVGSSDFKVFTVHIKAYRLRLHIPRV